MDTAGKDSTIRHVFQGSIRWAFASPISRRLPTMSWRATICGGCISTCPAPARSASSTVRTTRMC
jgi:hypothetical protein